MLYREVCVEKTRVLTAHRHYRSHCSTHASRINTAAMAKTRRPKRVTKPTGTQTLRDVHAFSNYYYYLFFLSTYHLLYMRPERWGCTWLREVKQKKFLNPITAVTHVLRAKGFQISRVRNDKGSLTGIFPAQTCGMIQHFWDRRNIQIVSELQNGPTLPKLLMLKQRAAVPEQQMFPM